MGICFTFKVGGIMGSSSCLSGWEYVLTFKVGGIWEIALVRVDGNLFYV
jgi:hypothetical protein